MILTIDETLKLFEKVTTITAMWPFDRVVHKKARRVYDADTYTVLSAKIGSLIHKVESISWLANAVLAKLSSCEECEIDHITIDCPILA